MRDRHCQHCYDQGYADGKAATPQNESSEPESVRISLTDEIRMLYGIVDDQVTAAAIVEGDRIIAILDTYPE